MSIRIPALLIMLLTALAGANARARTVSCDKPWLFFDLGANTLIDTQTTDFKQIYYMPGALEYLTDLKAKGYHLGLLVNIPQSWGKTQAEKLATTQKFILDLWTDKQPLRWDLFDLGVAFPPTDRERKPAPFLFEQAMARASEAHCDAVYQGTIEAEIPAAGRAGMIAIRLGQETWSGSYYYPEAKLARHEFPR